jgi:hypothetical protein
MSFPSLEKIVARFLKKDSPTATVTPDRQAVPSHESAAKEQIEKEASLAPGWREELVKRFPDHASVIESMFRNFQEFIATGVTPERAYLDFRYLYFKTTGISNDQITGRLAKLFPAPALADRIKSSLGDHSATELSKIVDELKRVWTVPLRTRMDQAFVVIANRESSSANQLCWRVHNWRISLLTRFFIMWPVSTWASNRYYPF